MTQLVISFFLWFLEIVCVVLGTALMTRTVNRFLAPKKGLLRRIAVLLLFAAAMTVPSWLGDANFLFMLLFFVGVFLFSYSGDWPAKAVMGAILYTLIMSWNTLVDSLADWPGLTAWLGLGNAERYINAWSTVIFKIILWVAVYFVAKKLVPENEKINLPRRLWFLCGVLALTPFAAVLAFSIWQVKPYEMAELRWNLMGLAYTILIFAILSSAALLYAITVLSKNQELEQASRFAALREVYYQGLLQEQTGIRTLRHDMRNHLAAMQGLLDRGDVEQAQKYLQELVGSKALASSRRWCDNETANAVLSGKVEMLETKGLRADFVLNLPKALPLSDVDLGALLGNALDNAAQGAAGAGDNAVLLRARADKGMLMLRVENAIAGEIARENGRFVTTKAQTKLHGFGLRSMEDTAARYGGTMEAKAENGRFSLVVCIPMKTN